MEEPGEQGTVVFALIVMELASECVCRMGGGTSPPPRPLYTCRVRTNHRLNMKVDLQGLFGLQVT